MIFNFKSLIVCVNRFSQFKADNFSTSRLTFPIDKITHKKKFEGRVGQVGNVNFN